LRAILVFSLTLSFAALKHVPNLGLPQRWLTEWCIPGIHRLYG